MGYVRMRLEYFKLVEQLLAYDVYIKMYLNTSQIPVIEVIKLDEAGETIIMKSDYDKSNSKNILDLIHEMSTRLNNGEVLFPQYAKISMRRKTLDNVLAADYQIYFYKLVDNKILSTISKVEYDDIYDIFIATEETMKESFEMLDAEISKRFGFFPNLSAKEDGKFDEYATKLVRERRKLMQNLTPYRGGI